MNSNTINTFLSKCQIFYCDCQKSLIWGYRYRFNGKENDNETYGSGNAYDFGARIYDSRLGRWLSLDPLYMLYPFSTPYNFSLNNPIFFKDHDGRDIIPTNQFNKSKYAMVFCKILTNLETMPHAKKYILPFLSPDKIVILQYHNTFEYNQDNIYGVTNKIDKTFIDAKKWELNLPKGQNNYGITFNSAKMFEIDNEQPSGSGGLWGQALSEVGIFMTIIHEFQHANGAHHTDMVRNSNYQSDMKNSLVEYFGPNKFSSEQLEALSWVGLEGSDKFKEIYGEANSDSYRFWYATVTALMYEGCGSGNSNGTLIEMKNEKPASSISAENCGE